MTATYRALLRLPYVPQLFAVACLSRLAGQMFSVAIILYVLGRFHSPVLAGWVSFASLAPGLAVSPLAGALLDRIGAARAMAINLAASGALLLMLAVGGWAGLIDARALLVLVTLQSLTSPLGTAGVRVLIPELVPPAALDRANALDTSSFALIDVLGAAMGGVLIGFAGPDAAMLVIAVLPLAASLGLMSLVRRPRPARQALRPLLGEALAAVTYVVRHRTLRALSLSYALYQAAWGILMVAVPVFVMDLIGRGPAAGSLVGLLWALAGLAGGASALVAGHWRTQGRERLFISLGILGAALAIAVIVVWPSLAILVIGLVLVGLVSGPVDVAVLTLRQRRAEPQWLGRVMAVSMSLNMCGAPLGAALGGVLVTITLPLAFAAAVIVAAAGALAARAFIPAEGDRET
jgi:MFS family permease